VATAASFGAVLPASRRSGAFFNVSVSPGCVPRADCLITDSFPRPHRMSTIESELNGSEIAVISVAGRFPGAPTLEQYWVNVRDGIESVRFFSDEELLAAGEDPSLLADPAYVRAWPQLEGIENFDAGFFGMSPRDASVMDPQHRFFLEVAWEAMERAGYSGKSAPMATGVFAATGMNHYMLYHVVPNKEIMRTVGEWLARHNGNDMNFLATRAAYQMNLKGPAMNVQTACSSSLTAIHIACQSLLNRETDLALASTSRARFSRPTVIADRSTRAQRGRCSAVGPDAWC
jgi:acyl transferase domain-containing protein